MSAEKFFNQKLNALSAALDITLNGDTAAQRFQSLHTITRNKVMSSKVEAYARFIKDTLIANFAGITEGDDTNIKPHVQSMLFYTLVNGMAHIYPKNNYPKTHHWLPVTYMKPFGIKAYKGARAVVPATCFTSSGVLSVTVNDIEFAHNRDKGYDLAIEAFFNQIETAYTHFRHTHTDDPSAVVAVAAFAISQSVRNPHPKAGFIAKDIVGVVDALLDNLDKTERMFAHFINNNHRLPISPYTPMKIRQFADGNRAFMLPILPQTGFVLSSKKPLTQGQVRVVSDHYREGIMKDAQRNYGVVFGMHAGAVLKALEQM